MSAPSKPVAPSILTSDIHNEADVIFKLLQDKDKQTVSMLDAWVLMRGMGMNPTNAEMDQLFESMVVPLQKIADEKAKQDKKDGKGKKEEKAEKKKGKDEEEVPVATEAPEDEKKIDWTTFITAAEAQFKDARVEEEEMIQAFRVLDRRGLGYLEKADLTKAMTQSGESVLAPAEVKLLLEMFPGDKVDFREFAQRMLGTWVERPPPPPEAAPAAPAADDAPSVDPLA